MQKGLPDHAVTIALATALQESELRNLTYGDRDSVGLFQQRPSQGWGTPAQIEDPVYAASVFDDHLVRIQGWESMPVTEAAQLVQLSASARRLCPVGIRSAITGRGLHRRAARGAHLPSRRLRRRRPAVVGAGRCGRHRTGRPFLRGHRDPTEWGWQVAAWAVAHAYNYHLTSVSFGGRLWTPSSGSWDGAPDSRPVVVVTP